MQPVRLASVLQKAALALLARPYGEGVMASLAAVGEACAADRAWIYRYDADVTRYWVTHEWCRSGVEACLPDIQGVPVDLIAWVQVPLVRGEAVAIRDVEAMPAKAQELKEELRREHVRACLGAPMFHGSVITGVIGLDDTSGPHAWTEDEERLLRLVGELIVATEARSEREANGGAGFTHPEMPKPGGVYLHASNTHVKVHFEEIVAIEANGDYSRVRLRDGRAFHELRSLRSWETVLPQGDFLRVHRRHVVALGHLRRLQRSAGGQWRIELDAPRTDAVPVGRSYQDVLKRALALRGA